MAKVADLFATIEAVHAAGLDAELWPQALAAITQIVGGAGTTLEVIEKPSLQHREFHSFGLPPAKQIEYLDHYAPLNPRIAFVSRQQPIEVAWDRLVLDKDAMDRSPFYAEFLARMDLRYFVGGVITNTPREFAALTVQR